MIGGWLQAFRTGFHPRLISETDILEISEKAISEKTEVSEAEIEAKTGHCRLRVEAAELLRPGRSDPIAEACVRGWQVEVRPAGLLIDTLGHPSDPALMDRLHAAMNQELKWPAAVLADPAEVVLRGELNAIETVDLQQLADTPTSVRVAQRGAANRTYVRLTPP